jgi:D-alanyl-D-alanine carboxypeptidase
VERFDLKKNLILKALALTLSLSLFSPLAMASYAANSNTTPATNNSEPNLPDINAQSALTMDLKTGEVIYCKDADSKRYPASTTKLLTGLL